MCINMTKCAYLLISNGTQVISCNNNVGENCNMCNIHSFVIPPLAAASESSMEGYYEKQRQAHNDQYPDEPIVFPNFCYGPDDPLEVESTMSDVTELPDDPNEKVQCSFIPTRGTTPGIRCTVRCKRGCSEKPLCAKHKPKKSRKGSQSDDSEYEPLKGNVSSKNDLTTLAEDLFQ